MRSIEVAPAVWATLDDEDYERLSEYEWKLNKSGYAYRLQDGKAVYMHREVMVDQLEWRKGSWQVHHLDENKLNNQRRNLYVTDRRFHRRAHSVAYAWKNRRVCGTRAGSKRSTF